MQLEQKLRQEEDQMFKSFQMEREKEKNKLTDEINKEWEVKLKELTDMYEKDVSKKKKKMDDKERKVIDLIGVNEIMRKIQIEITKVTINMNTRFMITNDKFELQRLA